jgi:magnesium-transporting ATPase (P-type)
MQRYQKAQFKIVMITGDNQLTALSVARQLSLGNAYSTQRKTGAPLHLEFDNTLQKYFLVDAEREFARAVTN